jgi:hypothetical protein
MLTMHYDYLGSQMITSSLRYASAFLLAFLLCSRQCAATLISAIPTKDGLVVVADKRVTYSDGRAPNDSFKKIKVVKGRIIVATAGDLAFSANGQVVLDINDVVCHYLEQHLTDSPSIMPHRIAIHDILQREYKVKIYPTFDWKSRPHQPVFMTYVFNYDHARKCLEAIRFEISIFASEQDGRDVVVVGASPFDPKRFESARVFLWGADSLYLKHGLKPYESVRDAPWFKRVSFDHEQDSADLTKEDGIKIGMNFVDWGHKVHPDIVGATMDCVTLTSRGVQTEFEGQPLDGH